MFNFSFNRNNYGFFHFIADDRTGTFLTQVSVIFHGLLTFLVFNYLPLAQFSPQLCDHSSGLADMMGMIKRRNRAGKMG